MAMSLLRLVTISLVVSLIGSQVFQLPENGCYPLFQYQGYQGQFIGLVTVRHPMANLQTLILRFSHPQLDHFMNFERNFSMLDDVRTNLENLRQGLPIRYRVDFPIPRRPPKITSMNLNGKELCGGTEYPVPNTALTYNNTWKPFFVLVNRDNTQPIPSNTEQTWRQVTQTAPNDYRALRPNPGNDEAAKRLNEPWPQFPKPEGASDSQQTIRKPEVPVPSWTDPSEIIGCGRMGSSITPLIFQGRNLERGQLPWLVAIFERRENNGPAFICGGSLISTTTVISAAHCFRSPGRDVPAARLGVSLGRNSLAIQSDGEYRGVSQLVIHENYQIKQFTEADLALVRLDEPVRYNDYISPICLWGTMNRLDLPQGLKSYVAGWGPDETGTGTSDVSKITDLNIVIESNCIEELPHVLVQPSTLCAKKTAAGPCASDGGGPLMLREQGVWVLRGVISGGAINEKERTCELSKPSVFTDVAKHIDWVRRNMWN